MNTSIGPFNTVIADDETPAPSVPRRRLERREAPYYEGSFFEGGELSLLFFTGLANPFQTIRHKDLQDKVSAYTVLRSIGIPEDMIGQAYREPRRRLYNAAANWWATNAERFGQTPQSAMPAFSRLTITGA